jgi:hypothetical protein
MQSYDRKPEVKRSLEVLGVDEKVLLKWFLTETGWESVDWIHLNQVRDHWRAIMNTAMNPGVPSTPVNFLMSSKHY